MKKLLTKTMAIITVYALLFVCCFGCGKDGGEPQNTPIKNVIIVIGDGMGLEHIKAGEIYEDKNYSFKSWHNTTVNTNSKSGTTDSAAGGTALATGTLTKNGYVGKSYDGEDLETVLDVAKTMGKSTAVITTDKLYGATPASFSAHSLSRNNKEEIIESQIKTSNVDLLCGAYSGTCNSYAKLISDYGYDYCSDFSKIDQTLDKNKLYWQFDLAGTSAKIELYQVVEKALDVLEEDQDGFVMMIEQAYVDKYSHSKDVLGTAKSVKSLNDTVELVIEWIGERDDTAVLITADHETGGLTVSEKGFENAGVWSTLNTNNAYYRYASGSHTKTPVGLFVYGVAPKFQAFNTYKSPSLIKNIETSQIIKNLIINETA